MGWYKTIKHILAAEPENWLAYLHGQQTQNISLLTDKKPRYRGFLVQVAKFGAKILRDTRIKSQPALKKHASYFVYAGTANQKGALDPTAQSLREKGAVVTVVANHRILQEDDYANGYVPFQYSLKDVWHAVILLVIRGYGLYKSVKVIHPVSVDWHFAIFCSVYGYLSYFYRVLSQVKPDFVLISNDHNAENRCLIAVAHQLGIKTVYMQHASVSNVFPALRFNYAFLDGRCALDTYRLCEGNQPHTTRNVPKPSIVLSGQKKHLKRTDHSSTAAVGVALNALDNAKEGIDFVTSLVKKGIEVRLRWHPGQPLADVAQFKNTLMDNQKLILSDPKTESISEFMEKIGWLVAGNSSIHLEAALAGVQPIYYELTPPEHPDYYGYVKHGLTHAAASIEDIFGIIQCTKKNTNLNIESVRYYSATYMTEWDGKEGDLVAECLVRLNRGQKLPVNIIEW